MTIEIIKPADRDAWLAARRKDVTASVAGCLLGIHPYMTAYGLWAEKTGQIEPDTEETPALRRGRLLEPVVAAMLREERPDWWVSYAADNTYYRDPTARLGATPDSFARRPDIDGQGIVQFKTVSEHAFRDNWLDPDTRDVVLPLWIAVQAIVEADLTEAHWATVAAMVVGRGIDLHIIDVPVHAGIRRRVRGAVAEFWALVDAGGRPDVDWKRDGATVLDVYRDSEAAVADLTSDADIDTLVARYLSATEMRSTADKEANLLKPQIIDALGNAEAGETARFQITAKTQIRKAYQVKESSSRPLRIKQKETAA